MLLSRRWLLLSVFASVLGISPISHNALGAESTVVAQTSKGDVDAIKKRVAELGKVAKLTQDGETVTELVITDGSSLTDADIDLISRLQDLKKLQILNCRMLNTELASKLFQLKSLKSLSLTNTVIDDDAVIGLVKAFPELTELDLSSNANMSSQVLKPISQLANLQSLLLIQNRLNEISTRRLSKLQELKVLDLRGNMEAGDMTLEVLSGLPKLKAFKHRSTAVTDYGLELFSKNTTLENLLIQDFAITNASGQHLAKFSKLAQLEIFRCQGFGSEGVLALKGMDLQRLTLRDLPVVDDSAMEVLPTLKKLRRLYIQEISGVTDGGLKNLEGIEGLELLDIWSVPQMTDATVAVIAKLPNLKELSIRSTGVTDASIDQILKMPNLESLTFKDNGFVTAEGTKKLASKKWKKLDVGGSK